MSKMTSWMVMTMFKIAIAIVVGWDMLQRVQRELGRVQRVFRIALIH